MKLSTADQKILTAILDLGHALERSWPQADAASAAAGVERLKSAIEQVESARSEDLRRLKSHADHLTPDMTARHLAGQMIAFERLSHKSLRDDEFLVQEGDTAHATAPPQSVFVIADNIRSAFNVGAIFRTSECFNIEGLVLTGYTPTPDQEKTARTSMGTQNLVAWKSMRDVVHAVTEAKIRGYTVVALETVESALSLDDFKWPEKVALLIGNERFGVDREALAHADQIVKIPLRGRKNSLNVGIALGIALAARESFATRAALSRAPTWVAHETRGPTNTDVENEGSEAASEPAESAGSDPQASWRLEPIGLFHSPAVHPYEARRQGSEDQSTQEGWIELFTNHAVTNGSAGAAHSREARQGLAPALADLDGFSHIWLVYRFHRNLGWKPLVMPPRGPQIKRGVFATRAPYRPNAIGLSCVELVRIEGLKIFVRGFDLLDHTPIFDIKPYLPYADAHPKASLGWLEGVEGQAFTVRFSPAADDQLNWLESHGLSQLRGFLTAQLQFDPIDHKRKRIEETDLDSGVHRIAYRTWRADFYLDTETRQVSILSISSGYRLDELDHPDDPHADKLLHRKFLDRA